MKSAIGLVLAFAVGFACRAFGIPSPAPPVILGALLVMAMTVFILRKLLRACALSEADEESKGNVPKYNISP